MALITPFQAAELSAPLRYCETTATRPGTKAWHVWIRGKENSGPHALVECLPCDGGYRSRAIRCGSLGAYHGDWLGAFTTRKLAAHAALI